MPECDFCGDPESGATFLLPHPPDVLIQEEVRGEETGITALALGTTWHACETCARLVRLGLKSLLVSRTLREHRRRIPGGTWATEAEFERIVRETHGVFWRAWQGAEEAP